MVEVTVCQTVVVFGVPRLSFFWVVHFGVGHVVVTELVEVDVFVEVQVV